MKDYVYQQYIMEKTYVEQCCKIPFNLTFREWIDIYSSHHLLYTMPPVTKDHWLHQIDKTLPIDTTNYVIKDKLVETNVVTANYAWNKPTGRPRRPKRGRIHADIEPVSSVITFK